ncbi:MAG TPA: hypothetical protein VGI72_07015 [Gaiellales bacterium]|jgi:hypothetical protein
MSDAEQTPQEAAAEFMRTVPVQDVVVSMVQTVFDVGYRRTGLVGGGADEHDLNQTRLAIETIRALLPVLEQVLDDSSMTTLRGALSELQLAYADAAAPPPDSPPAGPAEPPPPPPAGGPAAPERPRIWTPGGDV